MWKVIRYRRLQALVIAALAALITTCAVFAPLYDRDVQQGLASSRLREAPVQVSGLALSSEGPSPLDSHQMDEFVPVGVERYLRPSVATSSVNLSYLPNSVVAPTGPLVARDGACSHLRFPSGQCPTGLNEIAISTADAKHFGWRVGSTVHMVEKPNLDSDSGGRAPVPPEVGLKVVGVYEQVQGDYWFGTVVTGRSGAKDPESQQPETDDLITSKDTLLGAHSARWLDVTNTINRPLRLSAVGVDQLLFLGPKVDRLVQDYRAQSSGGTSLDGYSGLPGIATEVAHGRNQAQVIVPLLMVQLGLLAVVVLWLVLGAAIEQRRPEVALARLRGRGVKGARRLLLGELCPVILAGVVVGALAGLLLSFVALRWFLPDDPPFEIGIGYVVALVIALVAVLLLAVASARKVATEPVSSLLRRVPARPTGWAIGILDAMVIAASAMAVFAFSSGNLKGPVALAAPSLLALMVGLVLAHLLIPVAAALGRRLLDLGHVTVGVSMLQVARRPATRRVVALVTVASALLVFSADALAVGARNRGYAAEQVNGAAYVATLDSADLVGLRTVLNRIDPHERRVTPVVTIKPPGSGGASTEAVDPVGFRRIALFPDQKPSDIRWSALALPRTPPLRVVGGTLSLHLSSAKVTLVVPPQRDPLTGAVLTDVPRTQAQDGTLSLQLVGPDERAFMVRVAQLPKGTTPARRLSVVVPCEKGCALTGIAVQVPVATLSSGTVSISGLTTGPGHEIPLGAFTDWQKSDDGTGDSLKPQPGAPAGGLNGVFAADGGGALSAMRHASVPVRIPAVSAGRLDGDVKGNSFDGLGLDGVDRPMTRVASVPRLPAADGKAVLVNLQQLERDGLAPAALTQVQLWFDHRDPALLKRIAKDLAARDIHVQSTTTLSAVRHSYDQSAPAWGLELAVVVGTAGLLIAALVLIVVAATTWRLRSRDFAALRMSGLPPGTIASIATGEQLPIVVLAVVVGAVCGVIGAQLALPRVPLFASTPAVSTLNLSAAWGSILAAAAVALVVLAAVGWLTGVALARRAALERLRESL